MKSYLFSWFQILISRRLVQFQLVKGVSDHVILVPNKSWDPWIMLKKTHTNWQLVIVTIESVFKNGQFWFICCEVVLDNPCLHPFPFKMYMSCVCHIYFKVCRTFVSAILRDVLGIPLYFAVFAVFLAGYTVFSTLFV